MPRSMVEGGPSSTQRQNAERERQLNAQTIIRVGRQVGASDRDILIALMTAYQESGLRNLNYGDRDSVGLFQQRTSMGWGTTQQIMNPEYSARAFFLGAGTNKGLLDYADRSSWSLTQAAQKVQRSAFPDAYAKHEKAARDLLSQLGGESVGRPEALSPDARIQTSGVVAPTAQQQVASPVPTGNSLAASMPREMADMAAQVAAPDDPVAGSSMFTQVGAVDSPKPLGGGGFLPALGREDFEKTFSQQLGGATGKAADIIAEARKYLGTPYKWGGTGPLGFDCSGLLQYVFGKYGVQLPRVSFQQARGGARIGAAEAMAGDLWWIDNSSRNNGADHIALYLGNGQILEAPRAGLNVRIRSLSEEEMRRGGFTRYL